MPFCCCNNLDAFPGAWEYHLTDTQQECVDSGGCPGPFSTDEDDCAFACGNAIVSCCVNGICVGDFTRNDCKLVLFGEVRCPNGCPEGVCDDPVPCCLPDGSCEMHTQPDCVFLGGEPKPDEPACTDSLCDEPLRACCLDNGSCINATEATCNTLNGQWMANDLDCFGVDCEPTFGCRGINEPRYNPGDKAYSLQLCETAVMSLTKRPEEHDDGLHPKSLRGFMELATTHETRACRVGVKSDPCTQHYGGMVKDSDGYMRPVLWSDPYAGRGRWNVGVFTKQVEDDPLDRVPRGYVHARVGVENEPWSEVALLATIERCGIDV